MTTLTQGFVLMFLVNIVSVGVLCYGCYFRVSKNAVVAGSFVLFGVGIFLITYLLHGVDMSMEFAFGLFAVFTMLRYRTDAISIKEMTYLFLVTAIALLTAVSQLPLLQLLAVNLVVCAIAFVMDSRWLSGRTRTRRIAYERIQNILPARRQHLLADLRARTGLEITRVDIEHVDFLRDTADLLVHFVPTHSPSLADNVDAEIKVVG